MKHLTKNRKEILEIISASKKPLNVKQIKTQVDFDTSTIYRALDFLESLEYIHSVIFDNEKYYFKDKNGNFIICNSCRKIEAFPVQSISIHRCSRHLNATSCISLIFNNFICAHNNNNSFWAKGQRSNPIAAAIHVHNFTVKGNSIGACDKYIGGQLFTAHIIGFCRWQTLMIKYRIAKFLQKLAD